LKKQGRKKHYVQQDSKVSECSCGVQNQFVLIYFDYGLFMDVQNVV